MNMVGHRRSSVGIGSTVFRAVIAGGVAALAFLVIRERYHGECLWIRWDPEPGTSEDTDTFVYMTALGIVFLAAFTWCFAELFRVIIGRLSPTVTPIALAFGGITFALALYVSVGVITWDLNPVPRDSTSEEGHRLYLSVLWPVGLLQETGNFSPTFCGQ